MNLPSEQATTVYHYIYAEQTVLNILYFLSTLNNWFNLDINKRNSVLISLFKCRLLSFIRPSQIAYTIFSTLKD